MPASRLALPVAIAALALSLPAQWTEVGDAGQLPNSAQVIPYVSPGTLPSISGNLAFADVDMYLIEITDPASFLASTIGGSTVDTVLWLFSTDGRGVTCNDDTSVPQSRITGTYVPHAGLYYLAISRSLRRPTAGGEWLWVSTGVGEYRPDGPSAFEAVATWGGNSQSGGAYTITLTGCRRPHKELVVPDFAHLSTSAVQTGNSASSTNWWRTNGGRFQLVLEASHFQSAGFAGGYIDQLMFRGQSGEPNRGGQGWGAVQVRIGQTTATAATMTTDIAANLAAANNVLLTTLGSVTVGPSSGATPNNYNIRLPLSSIGGYYLPAGANLFVDVTMQVATLPATSGAVMSMECVASGVANVRAAGVFAPLATAIGTKTSQIPVIGVQVDALGVRQPPVLPATNASFGAGCGGAPSSFYQTFVEGQTFDLVGLTLTPDNALAPSYYNVTSGIVPLDTTVVNATPNSTADDATVLHPLGFSFAYPGGVTTSIQACTNGYVWLNGSSTLADSNPNPVTFLAGGPRVAAWWRDFDGRNNVATHPNSGLHVRTVGVAPDRVCHVTWLNVGAFDTVFDIGVGGHAVFNLQASFFERTNVIQLRYGSMPRSSSSLITGLTLAGFTRGAINGAPSVDPRSRDLSLETPFATSVEGAAGNMAQLVNATPEVGGVQYGGRAFAGQTLTFDAVGVPAGAVIGAQLLDVAASSPGLAIPTITAPGCVLSTSLNATLIEARLFPPATVYGTTPLVIPAGVEGFQLTAQYVVLDGLLAGGGPNIVTAASNAVRVTVGKR